MDVICEVDGKAIGRDVLAENEQESREFGKMLSKLQNRERPLRFSQYPLNFSVLPLPYSEEFLAAIH